MVDGRPGGAADRFWAELRALYEAAGAPKLSRLVRLGAEQVPRIKIADSTINPWLTGISVPSLKHQRYFTVLLAFLEPAARKNPDYSPRPPGWFPRLLRDARAERSAARRAGRPRGAAPAPGRPAVPRLPAALSGILLGPASTVPQAGDIGLRELGVHPAAQTGIHSAGQDDLAEQPPYVPRDQDAELDDALRRGGLVIVEGRSAAGKSRTAAEALRRVAAGRPLLVPADSATLRALAEAGEHLSRAVVWLDDLESFLGPDGLDVHLLNRLAQRATVVLATLRSEARRKVELRESGIMSSGTSMRSLTRVAATVRLPFQTSQAERNRAERQRSDPRIARWLDHGGGAGLPEYLAAGPEAVRRWLSGRDGGHLTGAALVSAAVDCRRAGYEPPLSRDLLADLYRHYLDPRDAHRDGLPSVDDGFAWAEERVHGASSCLIPQAGHHYQVFDYLTDHAERDPGAAPVPAAAWRIILARADGESLGAVVGTALNVGVATDRPDVRDLALDRLGEDGGFDATFDLVLAFYVLLPGRDFDSNIARWARPFAEAGHAGAMAVLGDCLARVGQAEEGEAWLRRAAAAGDHDAAVSVAQLLCERGDTAQLETWLNDALAAGHAEVISAFASWLVDQDQPEAEAERWLLLAAEAGQAGAMTALGFMLHQRGDTAAAKSWVQRAAGLGEPAAMTNLGSMLAWEGGEPAEVERWFRAAAATGFPAGQYNLAIFLHADGEEGGKREESERLLGQAARGGYPPAVTLLALLLHERGDSPGLDDLLLPALAMPAGPGNDQLEAVTGFAAELARRGHKEDAERWYVRAAEAGHPGAMLGVGDLCYERGDRAGAKGWYERGAERDEPGSMINLGYMCQQEGTLTDAEGWFERAARAGYPPGMFNLGVLLSRRGRGAEAEDWYRRAADRGHVDAMYNLGTFLNRHGRYSEARRWFQQAAQAGDTGAARALSSLMARHPDIEG